MPNYINHGIGVRPAGNYVVGDLYTDRTDLVMYVYIGDKREPEWFNNMEEDIYDYGWIPVSGRNE